MSKHRVVNALPIALFAAIGFALTSTTTLAQQGGPPEGKGPGGGGHTETATNHLSYPAALTLNSSVTVVTTPQWLISGEGYFSYGCPETDPLAEYPNKSCVSPNADGTLYIQTVEECLAGICAGQVVERIYWQKRSENVWNAETTADKPDARTAKYLDWGDNLESRSFSASSVIRVETTPFAVLDDAVCTLDQCKWGFQMWHVYGQGPDEIWGVRATDLSTPDGNDGVYAAGLPYMYQSPYAIIHSPLARLNIAKLTTNAPTCPDQVGGQPMTFPDITWFPEDQQWDPSLTCELEDTQYGAELNVGGKYVYGYNWMLTRTKTLSAHCTGWDATGGWWRLTFYTPAGSVFFNSEDPVLELNPPVLPTAGPTDPLAITALEEEGDTGMVYMPVIDYTNNLTYLDICVTSSKGGGGRRR